MVIKKNVTDSTGKVINDLVQWDTGVNIYLEDPKITTSYPVQFDNPISRDNGIVVDGIYESGKLRILIPDELLEFGRNIRAFVYVPIDGGKRSIFEINIIVIRRQKPMEGFYIDE